MEEIFEVVLITLFVYPGAFVRWTLSRLWRSKKKFKDFVDDDAYMNGVIGILTLVLLIWGLTKI